MIPSMKPSKNDDIFTAADYLDKALAKYLQLAIGRRVQTSRGPGTIKEWQPLGHAHTDALVDLDDRTQCWFALSRYHTKPIDGKGPLPSRAAARKLGNIARDVSIHAIAKRWHGTESPPVKEIIRGRTTTPVFRLGPRGK